MGPAQGPPPGAQCQTPPCCTSRPPFPGPSGLREAPSCTCCDRPAPPLAPGTSFLSALGLCCRRRGGYLREPTQPRSCLGKSGSAKASTPPGATLTRGRKDLAVTLPVPSSGRSVHGSRGSSVGLGPATPSGDPFNDASFGWFSSFPDFTRPSASLLCAAKNTLPACKHFSQGLVFGGTQAKAAPQDGLPGLSGHHQTSRRTPRWCQ